MVNSTARRDQQAQGLPLWRAISHTYCKTGEQLHADMRNEDLFQLWRAEEAGTVFLLFESLSPFLTPEFSKIIGHEKTNIYHAESRLELKATTLTGWSGGGFPPVFSGCQPYGNLRSPAARPASEINGLNFEAKHFVRLKGEGWRNLCPSLVGLPCWTFVLVTAFGEENL
ncbi:hypothetical protein ElyMa_006857600 [Elysia marginata]|uniref:Uncharacterized protein n=1 Tax=Elysia marginata TaxID=1093978 RepID=A0AAV4JA10_9GAST|nr:hypothetical protein ElyMa_006857600 [Elysia marginata]